MNINTGIKNMGDITAGNQQILNRSRELYDYYSSVYLMSIKAKLPDNAILAFEKMTYYKAQELRARLAFVSFNNI